MCRGVSSQVNSVISPVLVPDALYAVSCQLPDMIKSRGKGSSTVGDMRKPCPSAMRSVFVEESLRASGS